MKIFWFVICVLIVSSTDTLEDQINNIKPMKATDKFLMADQLQRYPFFRQNLLGPQLLARKLNLIPNSLKSLIKLSSNLVISNIVYSYCYNPARGACQYQPKLRTLISSYVNNTSVVLPDCYFTMMSVDQDYDRIIEEAVKQQHNDNEKENEEFRRFLIEIPSMVMQMDLDVKYERAKILVPHGEFMFGAWNKLQAEVDYAVTMHPWQGKLQKLFWRGKDRGHPKGVDVWSDIPNRFPRFELAIISNAHPEIIDAKFTEIQDQYKIGTSKHYKEQGLNLDENISLIDCMKYKYLIDIEGWRQNPLRVAWMLQSNSVVLKQQSNRILWFSHKLHPKTHYLPIHHNLSNLLQTIKILNENEQLAQQVAASSSIFIRDNFTPEGIKEEFMDVIRDLGRVQEFTVPTLIKEIMRNSRKPMAFEGLIFLTDDVKEDMLQRIKEDNQGGLEEGISDQSKMFAMLLCALFLLVIMLCYIFCEEKQTKVSIKEGHPEQSKLGLTEGKSQTIQFEQKTPQMLADV